MALTFSQFVASKVRTEDVCGTVGFDDGTPPHGGFVYDGCCYIEDNASADPDFAARGKYYLLIERSDWISDDLDRLEKILWASHYLPYDGAKHLISGDDIDCFIQGICFEKGYRVDGDVFGQRFDHDGQYTLVEAERRIHATAKLYALDRPEAPIPARLEIRPFLTVSTSHVSAETAGLLDDEPTRFTGGAYGDVGWFLWCATANEGDAPIPNDLWAVMEFARANGCDYLLLDRDGPAVDGLPTFSW